MASKISNPVYEAAIRSAVYLHHSNSGMLEIHGEDRKIFLQRQTTNDLELLAPDRCLDTVLTTATARILESFVLIENGDHISMMIPTGRRQSTEKFLRSHIFFMDKVEVQDKSLEWEQLEMHGPSAAACLHEMGTSRLPQLNEVIETRLSGKSIKIIGVRGLTSEIAFLLIVSTIDVIDLLASLHNQGVAELGSEEFQVLRIEAGFPAMGHELTQDYTPLEVGVAHWVSHTKGCYTGQEVIARQISYDKVTKNLVQLTVDQRVQPKAKVTVAGKNVGAITSAARSPRSGPIALAVIKRPHHSPGTAVQVEIGNGRYATGEVAILPTKLQSS